MTHTDPDPTRIGPVVDEHTPIRLSAQRLRNTLRLNAATSLLGGLIAVAAATPLSEIFGTAHPGWYRAVGGGLVAFAIAVAAVGGARMSRLLRWTSWISGADLIWTIASVVTVVRGWYSTTGAAVVGGVAAVVGWFGLRQLRSARRTRQLVESRLPAVDEAPPVEVVHVERVVPGNVSVGWRVITDHELYGRLAPNLSRVHAGAGNGPHLTRACTNRKGEEWHETCTLWDDQHRYEVAVDTSSYPYPLSVMRGAWYVEEDAPGRVRVGMDFRFQPRPGIWGRTFAAAMNAAFPPILRRILSGWRRAIAELPADADL